MASNAQSFRKWYSKPENRDIKTKYLRERRYIIRQKLIDILGDKCIQCGISDPRVLQIDHINGGGTKEVRHFKNGVNMYMFYINDPSIARTKLQILCANCNWIKRHENKEHRK